MTLRATTSRGARMVFDRLPANARSLIQDNRSIFRGLVQVKRNQAMLAQRLAELELAGMGARAAAPDVPEPRFPAGVRSRICTQAQLQEPWYAEWCTDLGEPPRAHRKLWEHAYIAHTLDVLGHLREGRRGLGFGVGREPLVALFAGRGCDIVATDLPSGAAEARAWVNTDQHAGGLEGLLRPDLCEPAQFRERVTWRPVDMRNLGRGLSDFDFCWSACSLEHLGSLDAGTAFIEESVATLRPGGVAVHTTEYNVSSEETTLASGPTVLYRRRDLEALAARLEAAGHEVAALDLDPGRGVLDEYVDVPPYVDEPHLRVAYGEFTTTSVAVIIRAGGQTSR